jgi:spore maturation protein CgeB
MPDGLDIAYFGSSLVSSWWNGAATYYRGIVRGLAEHGHRVRFFEPIAYDRHDHRDIDDPEWAEVVIYPAEDPTACARW